ncbi:hypothetical protein TNCV_992701 [Trichonephila clavipes]|nr:hypothetical protein TNCV_992701 [Trichonephila clavipes]
MTPELASPSPNFHTKTMGGFEPQQCENSTGLRIFRCKDPSRLPLCPSRDSTLEKTLSCQYQNRWARRFRVSVIRIVCRGIFCRGICVSSLHFQQSKCKDSRFFLPFFLGYMGAGPFKEYFRIRDALLGSRRRGIIKEKYRDNRILLCEYMKMEFVLTPSGMSVTL